MDNKINKNLLFSQRRQSIRQWCDETWSRLYHYVYFLSQNRQEAEDITQETYARIIAAFSAQGKRNAGQLPSFAYLKTTALNLIRDRWRQQQASGKLVKLEEELLADREDDADELGQILTRSLVQEMIARLSEEQRTVLNLRIVEGYSRAETALKMNRSEDSVRGLQYRALQNLRQLLSEKGKEADER